MSEKREEGDQRDGLTRRTFIQGSAVAAAGLAAGFGNSAYGQEEIRKTRSFNPDMEYRPCGDTGMICSVVCLGGHWKRINKMVPGVFKGRGWLSADLKDDGFQKNRRKVVTRCIERGINYIDACTIQEVRAYSKALKGRRDKMFLGCSWYQKEMRRKDRRSFERLQDTINWGLQDAELDHCDLWRITLHEQSSKHSDAEMDECVKALEWAKRTGRARFIGISSHDRPHIKKLIERYPELDVIVTPYTAKTKVVTDKSGLWAALKKNKVGWFGIKPFAGNSLFKGNSAPDNPHAEEDDRLARLAIRYILCNPAITAPIPGLINTHQVDNVARAVKERVQLDMEEQAELEEAMERAWANLPDHYQWLKDWEYV